MRIGLIADTHIPEAGMDLPRQVFHAFRQVDLILHAGDLHLPKVLDWLEDLAPVLAVRGNGDVGLNLNYPGAPRDRRVKPVQILTVEGVTLGMVHDLPLPHQVAWTQWDTFLKSLLGQEVQVAVCGHTHVPMIRQEGPLLVVNPGSPTMPDNIPGRLGTVGILEITGGQVKAQIVSLA